MKKIKNFQIFSKTLLKCKNIESLRIYFGWTYYLDAFINYVFQTFTIQLILNSKIYFYTMILIITILYKVFSSYPFRLKID